MIPPQPVPPVSAWGRGLDLIREASLVRHEDSAAGEGNHSPRHRGA